MTKRAPDIVEFEDLLNNTASDDQLSAKAIEICRRLQREILLARHGNRKFSGPDLESERIDFERVIEMIWDRRSKDVLNDYIAHAQTYGGPLDG